MPFGFSMRRSWMRMWSASTLMAIAALGRAVGDDAEAFFQDHVKPILRESCYECHSHGAERIRGGLVLDSRPGVMAGGDSGPAVVPGEPEQSRLIRAIRYGDPDLQMPPKNRRLSPEQVAVLEEWIRRGAPWPSLPGDEVSAGAMKPRPRGVITAEDRQWWAFQPVREPAVPSVRNAAWLRNPVDAFVAERLEREGMTPSPPAAPAAFLRRVTWDLTGLPPTPEETASFEAASLRDPVRAVSDVVDRLLASPRYGERWARHWLDLARYAESDGYRVDDYRPHVWRYRDWVVRALNEDLPYDQFVKAQIAGDELWPGDPERARVATAFLRHWIYEYNNRDVRGQWQTILNELTDVTGDLFLGLGVQCARCHDHKFDPILQKDYYRLQAFFAPLLPRQDLTVASESEAAAYRNRLAAWRDAAGDSLRELEQFEEPVRARAAESALGKFPEDIQALVRKPASEQTLLERQLSALAHRQIEYEWARLATHLMKEEKEPYEALQKRIKEFAALRPEPLPAAFTVTDLGPEAPPVFLPKSRDSGPVEPGFLSVLDPRPAEVVRPETAPQSTGRRATLASWLVSPENPLAARVLVNRVWQYHFGRGLAANSSDFGHLGEPPSHPELLDWLAARLVRDGWSLKQLHRWILTSATYAQAATRGSEGSAMDPENRWLGRFSTRRLEAEQIRDALFAVTGELDLTSGGPAADATRPRRTVYTRVTRNVRDPLLDVFDAPDSFSSTAQRNVTTTPTQALLLINQPFLVQRSRAFARRLVRESGDADEARITQAYRLAFGRPPTAEELDRARQFLVEQSTRVSPERPRLATFHSDKMPYREGRAAVVEPKSSQERFVVPASPVLPDGAFTVEGYVLLRTAPVSGGLRTIAARWDGDSSHAGWALGVTGKGVVAAPQTLLLRTSGPSVGEASSRGTEYSSGVTLDLNKPYYVAAAATAGDPGEVAVTFVVKDLSNDCEPPRIVQVRSAGILGVRSGDPFTLGGIAGVAASGWDGLLDDVRLTSRALSTDQLLLSGDAVPAGCVGWWRFEPTPGAYLDSTAAGSHFLAPVPPAEDLMDVRTQALADLCHVLLNSNEFLYTD